MKRIHRIVSLLLPCLLLCACLSGCIADPGPTSPGPGAATQGIEASAVPSTAAAPSGDPRGPMPGNGVRWREVFWDRQLPEDGYLGPDEVAFYLADEAGGHSVLVMRCEELLERVAALGALPRTRFFEAMLDERYTLLFACFDLAIELGSEMFCFPTRDLRGGDVAEVKFYISYSFSVVNGNPQYSATKDYPDDEGTPFHYMTVQFTDFDAGDVQKYVDALTEARRILAEMPEGLEEAERAEYLYRYVVSTVEYNFDNYYEETDWSTLYDALILRSTVCTGYAEAIYCLFNLAGIECLYLSGSVVRDHVTDFHAWNEAKINGKWYIFDATWDANLLQNDYPLDGKLVFFGLSDAVSDRYKERKPWPFMASVAPACGEILDPEVLLIIPPK